MAIYDVGYGSSSRLYERAPRALGMTPGAYRSGGTGETILYATVETAIGRVLVGATERGLCSVKIGANEGVLARALRAEFPAADVRRDPSGVGRWVRTVVAHLDGREPKAALPLDIRATAFQRQVWEALCRFRAARPAPIRRSPARWGAPRRRGRSAAPAPRIRCRFSSPAIACCEAGARWGRLRVRTPGEAGAPEVGGRSSRGERRQGCESGSPQASDDAKAGAVSLSPNVTNSEVDRPPFDRDTERPTPTGPS